MDVAGVKLALLPAAEAGRLSAQVEPFTAFVQQEPNDGERATERTELRFLVDRETR